MTLLDQLNESYIAHPKFQTVQAPLNAPSDKVEALNRLWISFCREGVPLSRELLTDAVATVFQDLRTQADDPLLSQFIDELHKLTLHHFLSDLDFLSVRKQQPEGRLATQRYFFTELSPRTVRKVLRIVDPLVAHAREAARSGDTRRESLSSNSGLRVRRAIRALNSGFAELGVLEEVSTLLPRKARVVGLAVELSVPTSTWWRNAIGEDPGPATMYAHLDESIRAPKAIVYLTDVESQNGPTSCFPGVYEGLGLTPLQDAVGRVIGNVGNTHGSPLAEAYSKSYHQSMSSPLFRAHFMALPLALRFNSHLGWDVLPSSDIEAEISRREIVMIGSRGTAIIFDGARLLHRGGLIEAGERVALQVVFGSRTLTQSLRLILGKLSTMLHSNRKERIA